MIVREAYAELPSTQERAVELARAGAEDGAVVVARRQSLGRGRGGRRWESPEGGLYLSVVVPAPRPVGLLPLAIGAELAEGLRCRHGVRIRLKWPNDLYAVGPGGEGGKLGGLLVDAVRAEGGSDRAVAGIGVNVRAAPSLDSPPAPAVALDQLTARAVALEEVERTVVDATLSAARTLESAEGERAAVARARGLLYGAGEPVRVDGRPVGTLLGIREDGAALLGTPDGPRALFVGELRPGYGP